jgi:hypothetical protein
LPKKPEQKNRAALHKSIREEGIGWALDVMADHIEVRSMEQRDERLARTMYNIARGMRSMQSQYDQALTGLTGPGFYGKQP